MPGSVEIPYSSLADKQRRYVSQTIPAIIYASRTARGLNLGRDARTIHEAIRQGRYVPEEWAGDEIRLPAKTLIYGGDCDDWAAVQLAAFQAARIPARLVTAGTAADHFEHVFVEVQMPDGRWIASDPKGSQEGHDFGVIGDWPVIRRWTASGRELATETTVSRARAVGSGADDPLIKCEADANKWLTPEQTRLYLETVKIKQGLNAFLAAVNALKGCYHGKRRSEMLAYIGQRIDQAAATISAQTGVQVAGASAYAELLESKSLLEVNLAMAAEWAVGMRAAGGTKDLRKFAEGIGGNPAASDSDLAAVAVAYLAELTTSMAVYFDDWIAAYAANPNITPQQVRAQLAPAGSGSQFSEIAGRVGRFARKVFITEPGRVMRNAARFILSADRNAPWLSLYFLRPLGFHLQATIVAELGNAMVDGSINTFNEKAVARSAAGTFKAAGQALLVAAPLLPPPWNIAAAAVGALSLAAGTFIDGELDRREMEAARKANPNHGDQVITYYVDEFGRQIDTATGLPVDPIQRDLELQRRQNLPVDPNAQTLGEWRRGTDGLVYSWQDFGQYGPRWVAASMSGENMTAAWVWTGKGWAKLA